MNEAIGKSSVSRMGMEAVGEQVSVQRETDGEEAKKAIAGVHYGKGSGIDGIAPNMLKYGGNAVVGWMFLIHDCAQRQEAPDEFMEAFIVPLPKGTYKQQYECNNNRGISLLSLPGKLYGRILTKRLMEGHKENISLRVKCWCKIEAETKRKTSRIINLAKNKFLAHPANQNLKHPDVAQMPYLRTKGSSFGPVV